MPKQMSLEAHQRDSGLSYENIMADIKLKSSHDWDFNDFRLTEDNAESVAQKVKIRLLRYLGEYFLDTTKGVDYFGTIFRKGTPKSAIDIIFIDEILNTVGVTSVDVYESIIVSGVYTASFVATTSEGITFQFNIQPIALL